MRARALHVAWFLVGACSLAAARPQSPPAIKEASSTNAWKRVTDELPLAWPRDHGSHPEYETEWWYATGDLSDDAGRRFGYQITLFRRGIDASAPSPGESRLRPRQVLAGNFAIVDVTDAYVAKAERVRRASTGLAGADERDLHAWVEDWRIDRTEDGALVLHATDVAQSLALDLVLEPAKPLVLHGRGGVSQKSDAPGNASVYTSWTRLATRGTIQIGRRDRPARPSFAVHGESWFDHEFGSSQLGAGVAGWDWFGLRLDDGRELMIYRLRTTSGAIEPASAGTLVERDGSTRHLGASEFALEPRTTWKSTFSGAGYPVAWKLAVPSAGIDCTLEPRISACEFDARASVGVIYWEGPVGVKGSIAGSGYLELTGYAAPLAGRF
jgi:predicted secreted hydrolase